MIAYLSVSLEFPRERENERSVRFATRGNNDAGISGKTHHTIRDTTEMISAHAEEETRNDEASPMGENDDCSLVPGKLLRDQKRYVRKLTETTDP